MNTRIRAVIRFIQKALTIGLFVAVLHPAITLQMMNDSQQTDGISSSVRDNVLVSTGSVKQFIAEHPTATDVSGVMPTVTGNASVIAFGTATDYVVCGYNAVGSPDFWKYSSKTGQLVSGNGSEAGLCGEPDQRGLTATAPHVLSPEGNTPVASVSGSGGALAEATGVDLHAGSSVPADAGSPSVAGSAVRGSTTPTTTTNVPAGHAASEVTR